MTVSPHMIENAFNLEPGAVFRLVRSVYDSTDAFADDFEQEYPSIDALRIRLDYFQRRPGSLFLVSREEDELLGYLLVVPRTPAMLRHTADLTMGVRETARGKGVGGALLNAALSRLREEGIIEILYLMVRADNGPALELYRTRGFETLATLVGDTKIGSRYYDGVLMRMRIPVAAQPAE